MSMCSINPLSILGMADLVDLELANTVVISAATSNTSKMLVSYILKKHPQKSIYGISRSPQYDS